MLGWTAPQGGEAVPLPPSMGRSPWGRAPLRAGAACPPTCSPPATWSPPRQTWLWDQASDRAQEGPQGLTGQTLLGLQDLIDLDLGADRAKQMVGSLARQSQWPQDWEGGGRLTCRATPGCYQGISTAQVSKKNYVRQKAILQILLLSFKLSNVDSIACRVWRQHLSGYLEDLSPDTVSW